MKCGISSDHLGSSTVSRGIVANCSTVDYNRYPTAVVDDPSDAADQFTLAAEWEFLTHAQNEVIARDYLFKEK